MNSKSILSRSVFALFVLALIFLCVQFGVDVLVDRFYPKLAETDWYSWALTALSLIVIGFPVYYILMRRIPNSPRGEVVKLKPSSFIVIFFICAGAMYITNIFSSILTVFIAFLKGDTNLLNPAQEAIMNSNIVMSLIYASIVAPIMEELIFRKLLLDKLRRFGDIPAILTTGIAFGLFHMNLSQFFYAAVLGAIFAYVTIRTNTIKYAILLHMMVNTISTAITPFVLKGHVLVSLILVMWMFTAILTGVIFFIVNIRNIRFERTEPLVKVSDYFLNAGTICYSLICFVMIAIITIFY